MNTITLSLNRLKYLFIEYFVLYWKRDLIIFASFPLAKIILSHLNAPFPVEFVIFTTSIILVGASNFFGNELRGMNYLMRPANTGEKLITNILLVHIYITTFLLLSGLFGIFIAELLSAHQTRIPLITDVRDLLTARRFWEILFAVQSFFIFTSIYFKKNAILKTLLFLAILFFVSLIIFIIGDKLNKICFVPHFMPLFDFLFNRLLIEYEWIFHLFNYVVIAFFWGLSYLRLKRTEV